MLNSFLCASQTNIAFENHIIFNCVSIRGSASLKMAFYVPLFLLLSSFLTLTYAYFSSSLVAACSAGPHEKRLLHALLDNYNSLERPVVNESDPLQLSFGLTLMQIIDVVSSFNSLPYLQLQLENVKTLFKPTVSRVDE